MGNLERLTNSWCALNIIVGCMESRHSHVSNFHLFRYAMRKRILAERDWHMRVTEVELLEQLE